jgi:phosphatidate cytidylyltransferase
VAGFRCRGARPRHRLLSQPRAALRPYQRAARSREAGRGRLKGQLAARIGTAAVLIAALLAALFLLPRRALELVVGLILLFAAHEWARLCRLERAAALAFAAAVALTFLALQRAGLQQALFALAAFFWIVLAPLWMWRGVQPQQTVWIGAAGFAVLVPAALAMVRLEPLVVLLVLVLVWIADTAAYFVGRAWGRRKLAPAISPGKTWEGVGGGLIGAALYAIILAFFTDLGAWLALVATALLLGMASIVGDLFESAVKRQAGVKDSGSLLPGHGGILDRIDSATAALPLAALLWPIVR